MHGGDRLGLILTLNADDPLTDILVVHQGEELVIELRYIGPNRLGLHRVKANLTGPLSFEIERRKVRERDAEQGGDAKVLLPRGDR